MRQQPGGQQPVPGSPYGETGANSNVWGKTRDREQGAGVGGGQGDGNRNNER